MARAGGTHGCGILELRRRTRGRLPAGRSTHRDPPPMTICRPSNAAVGRRRALLGAALLAFSVAQAQPTAAGRNDHRPDLDPNKDAHPFELTSNTPPTPLPARPHLQLQAIELEPITTAAWSPDSRFVAAGTTNGEVVLWNTSGDIIDRTALPIGAGVFIYEIGIGSEQRMLVEAWAADGGNGSPAGYEYRWRRNLADPPRMKWVDPPPHVQAMDPDVRRAAIDEAASHEPPPLASPDGRWRFIVVDGAPYLEDLASGARRALIDWNMLMSVGEPGRPSHAYDTPQAIQAVEQEADAARHTPPVSNRARNDVGLLLSPSGNRVLVPDVSPAGQPPGDSPSASRSTPLRVFDFQQATYRSLVYIEPGADVRWVGEHRLLITGAQRAAGGRVVDVDGNGPSVRFAAGCGVLPVPRSALLVIVSLGQCAPGGVAPVAGPALWLYGEDGVLHSLDVTALPGAGVSALAAVDASADGTLVRLGVRDGAQLRQAYFSAVSGAARDGAPWKDAVVAELALRATLDLRDGSISVAIPGGAGQDDRPLFRVYQFPGRRCFLAVTPEGRYDTNLPSDSRLARWVLPDDPLRTYAPQTFMRAYYAPDLMAQSVACARERRAAPCPADQSPVGDLSAVNRVLPGTTIVNIAPGARPGTAEVTVSVASGVDDTAVNGRTHSGVHDLRLYRDGRLVAERGAPPPGRTLSLEEWRSATRLAPAAPQASYTTTFTVALPTHRPGEALHFSAYAFNEDRVKGETAIRVFEPPTAPPRARQVYVLAIGIDAYGIPGRNLHYAVADAEAMAATLSAVTDRFGEHTFTPRIATIRGTAPGEATKAAIGEAFAALRAANPDDIVVVSWAGHGLTGAGGQFSLVPSDAAQGADGSLVPDSLVSSADLDAWLSEVDAGEIVLIIDACHSAASVDAGGFRPGPFGDPGLGQLAFDKGLRLLTASAADQLAQEDGSLGHGLLTYALTAEGVGQGRADLDHDGHIRLDEMLLYGVRRLPTLSVEVSQRKAAARAAAGGADLVFDDDASALSAPAPPQHPVLFDFLESRSDALLKVAGH